MADGAGACKPCGGAIPGGRFCSAENVGCRRGRGFSRTMEKNSGAEAACRFVMLLLDESARTFDFSLYDTRASSCSPSGLCASCLASKQLYNDEQGQRNSVRSSLVYSAVREVPNRFELCHIVIKATRGFHVPHADVANTINQVLAAVQSSDYATLETSLEGTVRSLRLSRSAQAKEQYENLTKLPRRSGFILRRAAAPSATSVSYCSFCQDQF